MNYTTWEEIIQDTDVAVEEDALSVYQAFEHVQDGRHQRGVRYSVALILTLIVLAKLAGMTTPRAIAEGVRLRAGWLRKVLPVRRESFPCAATYSNVLQALDAEQVNAVVTQWLTRVGAMKRCGDEPSRLVGQAEREQQVHVALDGKTLRGTLSHEAADQRKMHQLALYETGTGLVLKEQVVGDKENDLSIVSQFLRPVWVTGRIISADARPTQHTDLAVTSRTAEATSCCSRRAISRRYAMICTCFSVSRPLIARIGAPHAPETLAMGDWKSAQWWPVPNSTSFWRTSGQAWRRSFGSCGP